MRGAKPSSGLVHLHKSFVELHFAGRSLPQNVSVVGCVDGKQLSTVLPGQVYSTSCGADHWLLGLQLVFKAYKEPVITNVDKTGDSEITVAISTQGIQDKYNSDDPIRRAELQQAMEAAALKFAQTAVRRKEGRLQITGPNINIPKKQLRAQWPSILEKLAPQDVQAHIFVDSPDQYISCAAKIILTKAKAEPVFYLSGLSQLLKSYMGAFVTLELLAASKVVRLNVDTGRNRTAGPSLSTTAATSEQTGDVDSAVTPPAAKLNTAGTAGPAAKEADNRRLVDAAGRAAMVGEPADYAHGRALSEPSCKKHESTSRHASETTAGSPHVDSAQHVQSCWDRAGPFAASEAAAARNAAVGDGYMATTTCAAQPTPAQQVLQWKTAATDGAGVAAGLPVPTAPQQQLPPGRLEGMCSSSATAWLGLGSSSMPAQLSATVNALWLSGQPPTETPITGAEVLTGTSITAKAAGSVGGGDVGVLPSTVLAAPGVSVGSEAGLWLLADHAAQLQAVDSSCNVASETAAAVARQTSRCSGPTGSVSCSQSTEPVRPPSQGGESKAAASPGSIAPAGKVAAEAAAVLKAQGVLPAMEPVAEAAAAVEHPGATSPAVAVCAAASDDSIHPAALPQDHFLVAPAGSKQQRGRGVDGGDILSDQHARGPQVKRKRTSSSGVATAAADDMFDQRPPPRMPPQAAPRAGHELGLGYQGAAVLQEQWPTRRTRIQRSELLCPSYHEQGLRQLVPSGDIHDEQLHPESFYTAGQSAVLCLKEARQQSPPSLDPTAPAGVSLVSPCSASTAGALAPPAAYRPCRDDAFYLSQYGELHGDAGAVAVIHRIHPQALVTCQPLKTSSVAWQQLSKQGTGETLTAAAGRHPAGAGVDSAADWSPGQHCSPKSGTSSVTRHVPAGNSRVPGSSSPALIAAAAAGNAAPAVSTGAVLHPAAAPYAVEGPWISHEGFASTTRAPSHYGQQPHGWWQHGGVSSPSSVSAQVGDHQLGFLEKHSADHKQYQRIAHAGTTSGTAAALGGMPSSPQHTPAAQQQMSGEVPAAGDLGWLELPDADNLLLVGKGLVQVMNLLGAGTAARLALTRSLRVMSAQDREWLLSITYPHLQDSCRRKALPEMKMILNEVAGIDCFAAGNKPLQASAPF